ncbi:MAG: hypothetical protein R3E95_05590 [Thiolinea sp.]
MDKEGEVHDGFDIAINGECTYINLRELTGAAMVWSVTGRWKLPGI